MIKTEFLDGFTVKKIVAAERIELIARLIANQMAGSIRSRDCEVAISLIDELSTCFRLKGEEERLAKMRNFTPTSAECIKTHE